ncbi:MAG: tetratricopeptide repeat protein [Phycisphaerae bacterium]
MASRRADAHLAHIWQLPLLLLSLLLFGAAAYVLVQSSPKLTAEQKMQLARTYLEQERPTAALEELNAVLGDKHASRDLRGMAHLLVAESLELGQKQKSLSIPANHRRIVEQTHEALGLGVTGTAATYTRLGDSYAALQQNDAAVDAWRRAMNLSPDKTLNLRRKVIELMLAGGQAAAAERELLAYLDTDHLVDAERGWGLLQQASLLMQREGYTEAKVLLEEALELTQDPAARGPMHFQLGVIAWRMREIDEAERLLRIARDQLGRGHPLDAEAAFLLGEIFTHRHDPGKAMSFYEVVINDHPGSDVASPALLNRGLSHLELGDDDQALTDLSAVMDRMDELAGDQARLEEAVAGLQEGISKLEARQNFVGALELYALEQRLLQEPPSSFYLRLGKAMAARADQLDRGLADLPPAQRLEARKQARRMNVSAGDAYVAYARKLVMVDDDVHGEALLAGIELFEKADDWRSSAAALEMFVEERPNDPMAPTALLRLGDTLRNAGQLDRAADHYEQGRERYPNSIASAKSLVPLAEVYMAMGPGHYPRAERVLLEVLQNNPLLTPDSAEYRRALFELGELYHRTARYEDALIRFEEFAKRYPADAMQGPLFFMMGDCYRRSASEDLTAGILATAAAELAGGGQPKDAQPPATLTAAELAAARQRKLGEAQAYYERAIEVYRNRPPADDRDERFLKLAHFYLADCVYDQGRFNEAIALYDAAAFRYQDDPAAIAAHAQIVNAYRELGRLEDARTANERAKWLLRRIPGPRFDEAILGLPRSYWEHHLQWTGQIGIGPNDTGLNVSGPADTDPDRTRPDGAGPAERFDNPQVTRTEG